MKRLMPCLILVGVCTSISFAVWDYEITGGYHAGYTLTGTQSLLMTGGGVAQIESQNFGYVEIQGTAPLQELSGGIALLLLNDDSSMNYYGGETGNMNFYDAATATLQGGSVNYLSSFQSVLSPNQEIIKHITFICDVDSVNVTGNLLTGDWLDGSSFSITLLNQSGYDPVIDNIQFIPEPATLMLLGLGGLWLRKRKL